jgi:hypothetical protein
MKPGLYFPKGARYNECKSNGRKNAFLKLTSVGYLMLHTDITFDQSHGD